MKGFLRFTGVLEFIFYVVGVFLLAFNIPLTGINIFYFCIYLIFGPTIAVLLFAVAQILENTEVNDSKLDKLNKKVDLLVDKLVDDPSFKENSNDDPTFKALTSLTTEEKKQYKAEIQSLYNQFPFYRYADKVKDRMIDVRNEALESINAADTSVDAEKVVQAFKDALDELK